jgi:hypothetical protein
MQPTQQQLQSCHRQLLDHPPYCLGCCSNTWEIDDSTTVSKWKWLFMNGGDGNFELMRILEKTSVFPGTVLKIMAFVCKIGDQYKVSPSSHLIFKDLRALTRCKSCAIKSRVTSSLGLIHHFWKKATTRLHMVGFVV